MTARRALLSVYDKDRLVELATGLVELGFELVSSDGTAKALRAGGLNVTDVADVTGFPHMLHGRVKTLHPNIHGGILANLDDANSGDAEEIAGHNIGPFGLVVVNLYPFQSNPSIELIDVGGPAMIRGAAKNYHSVGVLTDPEQYEHALEELRENDGDLSLGSRLAMAVAAFKLTSEYDAAIGTWLFDEFAAGRS
jgi:phosphoribosylaminoimidazolecarboxamide formyltransferase/IMP cyclohydrolase